MHHLDTMAADHSDPRFTTTEQKQKDQRTLLLGGTTCAVLGACWCVFYALIARYDLTAFFAVPSVLGLVALACAKRCVYIHVVLLANAMLLLVVAMSAIDVPSAVVPRSAHLYLLPLAAASVFIFGGRSRYMGAVFPLLCLLAFVLFGSRMVGQGMQSMAPPAEARFPWSVINNVVAVGLLAAVLLINRQDMMSKARRTNDLARAIDRGQLVVLFQPQVDAAGSPIGAEALVRWLHPSRGLLSPHEFIPLAEETHLIRGLGLEVLRQACQTLAAWQQDPASRHLVMAVNVSTVQLNDPGFAASVEDVLRRTGAPANRLELELTESALSEDAGVAIEVMWVLRRLGVRWALDDFGTGYSSLSLLRALPVQKLKVDRQFVLDAQLNGQGKRLLAKIVEISDILGLTALAEGVESKEQRDMLIEVGCRQFQGYYFSRPVAAQELEARIASIRHAALA
ncbi:MAG: EAL domain-containing protein [Stenotrophomonas chelatiphaga]